MDDQTKIAYYLFQRAIDDFYKSDSELAKRGGMEQACVSRIAYYFQRRVNLCAKLKVYNVNVDCEYNKHADDPKRDSTNTLIRPDLILHNRGGDNNNILVAEFKAKNNKKNYDNDRKKLKTYTAPGKFNYKIGIFIVLKDDKEACLKSWEHYINGKQIEDIS